MLCTSSFCPGTQLNPTLIFVSFLGFRNRDLRYWKFAPKAVVEEGMEVVMVVILFLQLSQWVPQAHRQTF